MMVRLDDWTDDFLEKTSDRCLALLNDMIMIYDRQEGYFRPLNGTDSIQQSLKLLEKIMPPNLSEEIYEEFLDEDDTSRAEKVIKAVCQRVYNKISLNKHLYCKASLYPKRKNQNCILLRNGICGEMSILSEILEFAKRSSETKYCFLSQLDISEKEYVKIDCNKESVFLKILQSMSDTNPKIYAQTRNLLLNLITNNPKDHLLFKITSDNEKIRNLYLHCIKTILSGEFYTHFTFNDLMKSGNQLLLTGKSVNFCNQIIGEVNANDIAVLENMILPRTFTIEKSRKAYNFTNRTILVFSGTEKELEFTKRSSVLCSKGIHIQLPNHMGEQWFEEDLYRYLFKRRAEILYFAYRGYDDFVNEDELSIINQKDTEKATVNSIDSFTWFFKKFITITGERNDYILKTKLHELYSKACANVGLQVHDYSEFCTQIKAHRQYVSSVKDFKNCSEKASQSGPYFFQGKATKEQNAVETGSWVYNGLRVTEAE